jgi:tetratricopeptide (TPR) repeat protein
MTKLRLMLALSLLLAWMVFTPSAMHAETYRRDTEQRGLQALENGDRALKAREYEKSWVYYKLACDMIPDAEDSKIAYKRALDSFCKASCFFAELRIAEGRYADARNTLQTVLDERYNPRCKEAIKLLAKLEDPNFSTIGPQFRSNAVKIKQLMIEAQGYYEAGRYDLAFKRSEQVLSIDPYNKAARALEENINAAKARISAMHAETYRRVDSLERGMLCLENGDRALKARDYEKAWAYYKQACDMIPDAEESKIAYQRALDSFCKASCLFAELRIVEGRYADAQNALRMVLDERYNPRCKEAIKLLAKLEDPEWYKDDPQLRANAEKIKPLMIEARGYYETSRYNLALKRCEQILTIDPYNKAARTLQDKCESEKEAQDKRRGRGETP